jgi:hypothetical protein
MAAMQNPYSTHDTRTPYHLFLRCRRSVYQISAFVCFLLASWFWITLILTVYLLLHCPPCLLYMLLLGFDSRVFGFVAPCLRIRLWHVLAFYMYTLGVLGAGCFLSGGAGWMDEGR